MGHLQVVEEEQNIHAGDYFLNKIIYLVRVEKRNIN